MSPFEYSPGEIVCFCPCKKALMEGKGDRRQKLSLFSIYNICILPPLVCYSREAEYFLEGGRKFLPLIKRFPPPQLKLKSTPDKKNPVHGSVINTNITGVF